MNNDNDLIHQVHPVQQKPTSSSKSLKLLALLVAILFIAIAAGVSGYLFGVRTSQNTSQTNQKISSPPSSTITALNYPNLLPTRSDQAIKTTITNGDQTNVKINTLAGKLIYIYNGDTYASDINGHNEIKLIDGRSEFELNFAGWSDDGQIIYYTESDDNTFILYKKVLSSNLSIKLFSVKKVGDGWKPNIPNRVFVSNDGKYAIYNDHYGNINLYNITSDSHKRLFSSTSQVNYDLPINYDLPNSYRNPWSADNQRLVIRKTIYSKSTFTDAPWETLIVIDPFNDIVKEIDMQNDGPFSWSPTGRMLAIGREPYREGQMLLSIITDIDKPIIKNVLFDNNEFNTDFMLTGIDTVTWSSDNRIAFSYYASKKYGVAVYDINKDTFKPLISSINNSEMASEVIKEYNQVQIWLPDNKTLLLTDGYNKVWTLAIDTLSKQTFPIKYATTVFNIVQ